MNKNSRKELDEAVKKYGFKKPVGLSKVLKRLLKTATEENDLYMIGAVNYYYGLVYYYKGSRIMVLSYALKAASIFEKLDDYRMLAKSYNLLGIGYVAQENYHLALDAYSKVQEIVKYHKNTEVTYSTVMNNMAECYFQMGAIEKSTKLVKPSFEKAVKKASIMPSSVVIYGINLAECYEGLGEYDKAGEVLDKCEEHIGRVEMLMLVCALYARRACVAYAEKDYVKADKYVNKTLEIAKDCADTYEIHRDFEKIAHSAIQCGQFDIAEKFMVILKDYAKKTQHILDKIIECRVMLDYFNKKGDSLKAIEYSIKLNQLYEKRIAEEKTTQLEVHERAEAVNKEVKALMKKVKQSEEIAEKDGLTGLLNRPALLKVTNEFVEIGEKENKKVGGIFMDIDCFKEYNDTYGHAMGDQVIKAIADICIKEENKYVKFARYGGDEFLGITLGYNDIDVNEIAKRIARAVKKEEIKHKNNKNIDRVSVSIGTVNLDMKTSTIFDIVNLSDKALYEAKRGGKNAIYNFNIADYEKGGKKKAYNKIEY